MAAARKIRAAAPVDIAPRVQVATILPPRPMPAGAREVTLLDVLFSSPREWARTLAGFAGMAVLLAVVCSFLWSLG